MTRSRAWIFFVLILALGLLLYLMGQPAFLVRWLLGPPDRDEFTSSMMEPAPPRGAPPSTAVDATAVQRCSATDLVEATVSMQAEDHGTDGTRTLGTVTISTTSTEPLQVWVLVDEGERSETGWAREGWQSAGPPLSSGAPIEQRLSQTVYDDGDATWRRINAVAAWRTGGECEELPTHAQLDAIARPL